MSRVATSIAFSLLGGKGYEVIVIFVSLIWELWEGME
jgi:hypothetical protein